MTGPTTERQRHVILDALRGLALMGIALANFPEFALWTFLSSEQQAAMPTAYIDEIVRFLQYLVVDGKFYSIFSILFGIGFSLIMERHGLRLFVRRMLILVIIGFLHLMFIWSGDILLLYAVGGLLLTLMIGLSDKSLFILALSLIMIPVGLDALIEFGGFDFPEPFYQAWWNKAEALGINEANFASWLRDTNSYGQMFAFLIQGAYERLWEFVEGHRLPKVVGLFILGYLASQASAVYTFTGFALAEGSILECVYRSPYIIIICLECYEWTSLGTYCPFAALCRECDSSGHRIHNRYMPALSAEPQVCGVPMASCPRAYGTQLLYLPFAHWHSAVLWSRIRSWDKSWPRLYRIDSPCGILHSDYSVPHLAQLFPLRAAGMALADAHLRTLFPHNKIK